MDVEQVPDEYDHVENSTAFISVFYGNKDKDNKELLVKTLSNAGYKIPSKNVNKLDKKKNVLKELKNQSKSDKLTKCDCLMVFVLGTAGSIGYISTDDKEDILIEEVYGAFHLKCLENKPRLFFFQATESQLATDSSHEGQDPRYSVPAETDLFIVYKLDCENGRFIRSMCASIAEHGKNRDLIDIVVNHTSHSHQLIISTLTKRFYFISSSDKEKKKRGYHADMHDTLDGIYEHLGDVRKQLSQINANLGKMKSVVQTENKPRRSQSNAPAKQQFGSSELNKKNPWRP